jgi:predicted ester cyclase
MSVAENTAIARQFEDAFNRHDATVFDAHPGLGSQKAFFQQLWAAFPDMDGRTETTVAADDWVAQRVTVSGTMQGTFMGMPATGKRATWEVLAMFRIEGGKIVEFHAQADNMGMMQQLGLAPGGAPQPS